MTTETTKTFILEDLRRLAYDAYRGISFSPEKRAKSVVEDYSNELENDLKAISESERERYTSNYRSYLSKYLSAQSRTYSPMISGPSNFPTKRMEKLNRWVDSAYSAFREWRKRAINAIEKNRLASRTEDEVTNDVWKQFKKKITSSAATIMAIDLGIERGYSRPLFVKSITGSIQTFAKNGNVALVKLALDYVKELNKIAIEKEAKEIITAKNGIWDLEQMAEQKREDKVDAVVRGNEIEDFSFPNSLGSLQIIKNYRIDRIQVVFPDKPSDEVRGILRHDGGLIWAPSEKAWQRKLTGNAEWAIKRLIDKFSQIETEEVGRMAFHG